MNPDLLASCAMKMGDFIAGKLMISGWNINISVQESDEFDPDIPAAINLQSRYKSATIYVYISKYTNIEKLYKNMVHELCHVAIYEIDILRDSIYKLSRNNALEPLVNDVVSFVDESITSTMTGLFLRNVDASDILMEIREEVEKYEEENASKGEEGESSCQAEDTNP